MLLDEEAWHFILQVLQNVSYNSVKFIILNNFTDMIKVQYQVLNETCLYISVNLETSSQE